jgi:hypothetical protein
MKEVIGSVRDLEYRQEQIADAALGIPRTVSYSGKRGLLSFRTRERFRNGTPFRIHISKPRFKSFAEEDETFDSDTQTTSTNQRHELEWSDVSSDEVSTTVETEDSLVDITIIFDGGNSASDFAVGPSFDLGNAGEEGAVANMNNISIVFDGGSSVSHGSSDRSSSASYATTVDHTKSTMVSITFDGGTSTSNYVFGPSFDCGNSSENLLLDTAPRRVSNVSDMDTVSSSDSSSVSNSFSENMFVFDGGGASSFLNEHLYK